MQDMQVDISMLVETKLDTTKQYVRSRLKEDATQSFGHKDAFKLNAHSTPIKADKSRKPGGILQLTTGHHQGRIMDQGKDEFGRWVYTTYRCKGESPRTVITTYQVVKTDPYTSGPTTYATQLFGLYTKEGRQEPHNLRKHHANDLVSFVQDLQSKGHLVMVAGDFNTDLGEEEGGLDHLCSECNLIDPILTTHGAANFSTYNRGKNILDYILIDPELLPTIVRCGYEAFHAHVISDHRGVYIDVDTDLFFGDDPQVLVRKQARDIISTKAHQIGPYFDNKHQHLEDHNWFEQIKTLQQHMRDNIPNHTLAEQLYDRLLTACIYAGKRLPKYRDAPYSPELVRLRTIKDLLNTVYSHMTTNIDLSDQIENIKNKLDSVGYDLPTSVEECKKAQRQATKDFTTAMKEELKNKPLRKAHLKQLIKDAREKGDKKLVKALKHIQRAEDSNTIFDKLRIIRNKIPSGGLKHLLVPENPNENPKECQHWRQVDVPEEIEALLQERNRQHFGQSKNCNLTNPPTDFSMEFTGTCQRADQILNGTFPTDDLDELTKIFLEALQYVSDKDFISPTISKEDYLGKIKVWNERTSTSPGSNMHLGHLKAYTAKHSYEDNTPEADALKDKRDSILNGHLALLNYCLQFGFSFDSWKTIVNAMLEKNPGCPKIHRLRVIHLMEADYNLLLSVKWRAVLHHACNNGYVNEHQFGSQPGKEALDAVFIRELEYELTRLTRCNLLHFDNDASSCYDRIPCFLANVASRKYGMHRKVCVVQGKTLAEARYHLKTQLGVSEEFVQHSQAYPWFGTGQGSGNSPTYWLFICSTLFDIYENKAQGATYVSPDKLLTTTIKIVGFVDDTRNSTNQFGQDPQPPMETLIAQAQADSQLWNNLLLTCNQKLELTKCGFHAMEFIFENDGKPILVDKPDLPDLQLHENDADSDDEGTTIKQWANTKATRYLGCYECPADKKTQLDITAKKCKEFCRIVKTSHLSPKEAHLLYWTIYRPSVSYPLPMAYFTFDELDKAQRKVERAFTSKMGFNPNTPKAILHGPKYMGGAGLFHLYDDQGYGQCRQFIKSWRSPNSPQGKLLHITVAWLQFCAGVSWSVLGTPQIPLTHHLESKWLQSLQEFLGSIDGNLELKNPYVPKAQRTNDKAIMSVVVQATHTSGKNTGKAYFEPCEIRRINYCRMYLNVFFLSDICNAAGDTIDPAMYSGDFDKTFSTCNHLRVKQAKPNETAWKAWRRALGYFCYTSSRKKKYLKTEHHLTTWLLPATQLRRRWPALYDPGSDTEISDHMYCHTPEGWTMHQSIRYDFDQTPSGIVNTPPETAAPCDYKVRPYTLQMTGYENVIQQQQPETHTSINTLIPTLDAWEQHLLRDLHFLVPETEVWTALATKACILACDGSAPDGKGSFGWILSDPQGTRLAQCNGPAFGYQLNSYRAEGYGMLSGFRFLHHMTTIHSTDIPIHRHGCFCDNKSMVEVTVKYSKFNRIFPNSTLSAEWDIIAEIRQTLQQIQPATSIPKIKHIKGHQDDEKPYDELTLEAQLNVDADGLANQWLVDHPNFDHTQVPILPTSGCQLNLPGGTITHNLKHELKLAGSVPQHKQFLMNKHEWDSDTFEDIDWKCHGRALNRLDHHRTSLTKYLCNWHPVGKRVNKYHPKYPIACASCGAPEENREHVLRCPKRQSERTAWKKALKKYTDKHNTHPMLQTLLLSALQKVLDGEDTTGIEYDDSVADIANAQAAIGWDQLLKGRLSKQWAQRQDQHLKECNLKTHRKNGQTWLTGIIQELLNQWFELWEARNHDRHGKDAQTKAQAANRQVIHELQLLYDKYTGNLRTEQAWLLQTPINTRSQWPTASIRQWINTWEPVLEESYATQLETG